MIKNIRPEPYGVLFIDKSPKLTSHDVVDIIRKKLKIKRVGHTGTLDPLATGLLIILVGKSTKMQDKFQKLDKVYEGNIKFGTETDTWDTDGKILKQIKVEIMEKSVKSAIDLLSGNIIQQVPPYSAVKYKGQTLYKLARQNKSVPSINRVVNVNWLDWRIRGENLGFKIKCSSGTYIRSIAHQMGVLLGCGGTLSELRRLNIGEYSVKDAVKDKDIEKMEYSAIIKLLK